MYDTELQQTFLNSIVVLEQKAKEDKWCIYNNHCLLRVIYDYIFLDDWRNHISNKDIAVYKQLNKEQLNRGLKLIDKLLVSDKYYIELLNYASLKWRNKC